MDYNLLKNIFKSLDLVIFEKLNDGSFQINGSTPGWLKKILPEITVNSQIIKACDEFPFLENFLIDAETFWNKREKGRLKSGLWIKADKEGNEYPLEAAAVSIENSKILIIEFCRNAYTEKQIIIQKGRENYLNYHTLEKLKEELQAEKDYSKNIINSSLDMIFTVGKENKIIEFNKAAETTFGYKKKETAGQKADILFKSKSDWEQALDQIAKNGEFIGEIFNKKKNGNEFLALISIGLMRDISGEKVGMVCVSRDITNQKEIEKELRLAKNEAVKANKTKSRFLANMSHEIRTPMNAIIGYSEILNNFITTQPQKEYISNIRNSGKILLKIINDILDLSKVESGKLDLNYTPVRLNSIFREIYNIFKAKAESKGLLLNLKLPEEDLTILFDEDRLKQILINLTNNAIKFCEQGFIEIKLTTSPKDFSEEKTNILISIKDTGIGIGPENVKRIFKDFEQQPGQDHSKYGGTGLGLSITKRLVEILGGNIKVESKKGEGTIFVVMFNGLKKCNENVNKTNNKKSLAKVINKNKTITILSADDIDLNRNLIADYLEQYNVKILEASNGKEAIDIALQKKPDIVLMDLRMPVMDGLEASEYFRNSPVLKQIPILIVTASGMTAMEEKIKKSGFNILIKPFTREELLKKLNKIIPESICITNGEKPKKLEYGSIHDLKILVDILKKDFLPSWQEIHDKLFMDYIETWVNRLKNLLNKYKYEKLESWCGLLTEQLDLFDIKNLPATLKAFPTILADMEKLSVKETINYD